MHVENASQEGGSTSNVGEDDDPGSVVISTYHCLLIRQPRLKYTKY